MQLLAKNERGALILAKEAEKQQNYLCPECGAVLRVRAGSFRTPHFFHLQRPKSCRQNGKSLKHLETQLYLQERYVGAELEKRFPEIGRIADVVYEEQKIIFEVQVSPITLEEVESRVKDYSTLGYKVHWVFHDESFTPTPRSPLFRYFRFFTNIQEDGSGTVYEIERKIKAPRPLSSWLSQLLELIA